MKLISTLSTVLVLMLMTAVTVHAEEPAPKAPKAAKAPKPESVAMTLQGTIVIKKRMTKNKEGVETEVTVAALKTENGMVGLPKNEEIDYTAFDGQTVDVAGEGYNKTNKNKAGEETTQVVLTKVTSVLAKVEEPAE
jgi:hypothetical protein